MKYPCPLCAEIKTVRINRRSKPYLRCDRCGVLMFVNRQRGISVITRGDRSDNEIVEKSETLESFFE